MVFPATGGSAGSGQGRRPVRSRRIGRMRPGLWRSRRLFLEPLEGRLLLSVTPALPDAQHAVFSGDASADNLYLRVSAAGVLEYSETGSDGAYLCDLDPATAGTQTLIVTPQTVVTVDLAAGDDALVIQFSDSITVHYEGGAGAGDTLVGPGLNRTWEVTGPGTGTLNNAIHFSGVENLTGAANNEDTFVFSPEGTLNGLVDGGPGGFDTLVMQGGAYETVMFTALGPDSGRFALDHTVITYAGLEPTEAKGGTVDNVIIDLSTLGTSNDMRDAEPERGDGHLRLQSAFRKRDVRELLVRRPIRVADHQAGRRR